MEIFAGIIVFIFAAIGVSVVLCLLSLQHQIDDLLSRLDLLLPRPEDPRHKPQRTFPRVVK